MLRLLSESQRGYDEERGDQEQRRRKGGGRERRPGREGMRLVPDRCRDRREEEVRQGKNTDRDKEEQVAEHLPLSEPSPQKYRGEEPDQRCRRLQHCVEGHAPI